MLRHKVKPGITGLAQVNGCRGETDTLEKMEQRIQYDHRYIREWSLWLDLKILLKTVLGGLLRKERLLSRNADNRMHDTSIESLPTAACG